MLTCKQSNCVTVCGLPEPVMLYKRNPLWNICSLFLSLHPHSPYFRMGIRQDILVSICLHTVTTKWPNIDRFKNKPLIQKSDHKEILSFKSHSLRRNFLAHSPYFWTFGWESIIVVAKLSYFFTSYSSRFVKSPKGSHNGNFV